MMISRFGASTEPYNIYAHSSSLLPRGHVSSDGPTRRFLGSVDVDEKTELEGEKQTNITYDWDEQFEELQSFKLEYGHCYFPQQNASLALTRKYPTLSIRFSDDQRLDYQLHRRQVKSESRMSLPRYLKAIILSLEDLEILEQVDFDFLEWQPRMKRYRQENDGRFTAIHNDDPDLNCWMRHQRLRLRCAYVGIYTAIG